MPDIRVWMGRNTTNRDAFYVIATIKSGDNGRVYKQWGKGAWSINAGQMRETASGHPESEFYNTKDEKSGKGYEEVVYGTTTLSPDGLSARALVAKAIATISPLYGSGGAASASTKAEPIKFDPFAADDNPPEWSGKPTPTAMSKTDERKKAQAQMATSFGAAVGHMRAGMDQMLALAGATTFADLGEMTENHQLMKRALTDLGNHFEEMEAYAEIYAEILTNKLEKA